MHIKVHCHWFIFGTLKIWISQLWTFFLCIFYSQDGKDASSLLLTVADADVGLRAGGGKSQTMHAQQQVSQSWILSSTHTGWFVSLVDTLFPYFLPPFCSWELRAGGFVRCYSIPDTSITSQRTMWGFATREALWLIQWCVVVVGR